MSQTKSESKIYIIKILVQPADETWEDEAAE